MKKYVVIGNPIEHSLSPLLHNHWIKEKNLKAIYDKKKSEKDELKEIISSIKNKNIAGANVTIPFKNEVIKYLDKFVILGNNGKIIHLDRMPINVPKVTGTNDIKKSQLLDLVT